ncbi:mitochondrial carrier domain-containing protein [Rhodocollybia butyracea]|uniref:Mitochondrial carrier domain-containing protein n=1 Tax=Rhodocollybia butyracea TaxID=206335 RepID=A0A9P5PLK8_9AGAR|nr:mitochondrial carrier domain-containing protein [Rhodocollybia butyracea]
MNSSSSLRDLYSDTSSAWSFTPESMPGNSTSTAGPSNPLPQPRWKSRSPVFDLSPDFADVSAVSDIDLIQVLKTALASAMLQYTSTAIAMPWEVGKLLLQVQWVPRELESEISLANEEVEETSESDGEGEDDSYFADPNHNSSERHIPSNSSSRSPSPLDDVQVPPYTIPIGPQDGVWGMIKRIGRFRSEGWLALFKGLLTSCVTEVLSSTIQPIVYRLLQSFFPQPGTLLLPLGSHLITGFLLSPLDLIRTRLIVQSFIPRYRSYSGPIDALSQILRDEGGIKGIYLHPHLLVPTLLDCTIRPLVALALPGIIASYVTSLSSLTHGISEENNPIAWGVAELAGSCIGLMVTLPFETVRRRLQVQTRGGDRHHKAKPIRGCVSLRPTPYFGVVDAFYRIITEERSDVPLERKQGKKNKRRLSKAGEETATVGFKEDEGWFKNTGVGQLYRGLGMRLGASIIVFILAVVSGGESEDGGWAEL